jgi:repressor LexA
MRQAATTWERLEVRSGAGNVVPLLGEVAAGAPYQAFTVEDSIAVPPGLWGARKVFALRVRGASMIDEGIRDGDYLIVEPRPTAQSGQTVVAEVDGGVTVKRLHVEPDGSLRLQPANPEMLPLVVPAGRVRIIGTVVGVFRRQGFQRPPLRRAARVERPPSAEPQQTLDLTLEAIARTLREAEALARSRRGTSAARLRDIAQRLRALRDCYLETTAPKLKRALLLEASGLMRQIRRWQRQP